MSPTSQKERKLARNEVAHTPSWCKNIELTANLSFKLSRTLVNLQFGFSARDSYHVGEALKDSYIYKHQSMPHFNWYGWIGSLISDKLEALRLTLDIGTLKY